MRDTDKRALALSRSALVLGFILSLCSHQVFAESPLKMRGCELGVSFTGEYALRLDQPARQRALTERRAMLSAPLTVNTDRLLGVKAGQLSLHGMVIKEDPDLMRGWSIVDDAHAYSNLRAENRVQLFEVFWERGWGDWVTRLGKLDANNHFAVSESASYLINGAGGFSPTILGLPSYPDSAWSAQVGYQRSRYEVLMGVFDGGSVTLDPTPTGARFGLSEAAKRGGLFWVAQATLHLGAKADGINEERSHQAVTQEVAKRSPLHISVGAWTHRGSMIEDPHGSAVNSGERSGKPASGLYLTGDVKVAQFSGDRLLNLGWQAAVSPTMWPLHLGATLTLSEIWPALWGAEEGGRVTLGLSHLATQSGSPQYGLGDSSERLIEYTVISPLSAYMAISLSGIHLFGVGGEQDAHLIVSRLTLIAM